MRVIPLEADTVDQALAMLGPNTIQLILLDLHMPGQVDGEELLFQLRDQGDEIPIICGIGLGGRRNHREPTRLRTRGTQKTDPTRASSQNHRLGSK
jgi:CheY-like chemotaxis protein